MSTRRRLPFIFVSVLLIPLRARGEIIPLKDGKKLEGHLVSVTDKEVVVLSGYEQRTLAKADIAPPPPTAMVDAKAAYEKRDYVRAGDLAHHLLLLQPSDEVRGLWKRNHEDEIHYLVGQANRSAGYWDAFFRLTHILLPEDLPIIHEAIHTSSTARARKVMGWVLQFKGNETSVQPLVKRLPNEQDPIVRREIVHALGDIRSREAIPTLIERLETDPDYSIRIRAAEALNKIATPEALAAIRKQADREQHGGAKAEMRALVANPGYKMNRLAPVRRGQPSEGFLDGTRYVLYVPKNELNMHALTPLVAVHGTRGSADAYAGICREDAERCGLVVVAPQFDYGQYPLFGSFNMGRSRVRPDLKLIAIVDAVCKQMKLPGKSFLLFGHSEGGGFVQRFVLAHPDRVLRAATCGCGAYISPDPAVQFPSGPGSNPYAPDLDPMDFGRLVQTPLAIIVGNYDDPIHQQAARSFGEITRKYAADHHLPCRAQYLPVVEGGHSGVTNWTMAGKFLLAEISATDDENPIISVRKRALAAGAPSGTRLKLYLDCGEQTDAERDGVRLRRVRGHVWTWDEARNLPGVPDTLGTTEYDVERIEFELSGLAADRAYKLAWTWWDFDGLAEPGRVQRVLARSLDGKITRDLVGPTRLPKYAGGKHEPAAGLVFDLPPELVKERSLTISVAKVAGANAVISELWLLEAAE